MDRGIHFLGFEGFTVNEFIVCIGPKKRKAINMVLSHVENREPITFENRFNLSRFLTGKIKLSKDIRDDCNEHPRGVVSQLSSREDMRHSDILNAVSRFRESINTEHVGHPAMAFANRVADACEYLREDYFASKDLNEKAKCIARIVYYLTVFFVNNGERPKGTMADEELWLFLEESERARAVSAHRVVGSEFPLNPDYYLPRPEETEQLKNLLDANKRVVLTAMGGVGKTSIVLEFVRRYAENYKYFMYAVCNRSHPSLAEAIADDRSISITGLQRGDKSALTYAMEKLEVLDQLGENLLLVIDNYDQLLEKDPLYQTLQNTKCTQLITSRWKQAGNRMYKLYPLQPIEDLEMLRQIGEGILRNKGEEIEWDEDLDALAQYVHGNLKALEVLLGQMCASYLTPHELREQLEEAGVRRLELPESVDETGGNAVEMISMLFDISTNMFTEEMKRILYDLSMVPLTGIPIREYRDMADLGDFEQFNRLKSRSLIEEQDRIVHLHPIVTESVLIQAMKEKRSILQGSRFFEKIGSLAGHNWTIRAKERERISPITCNVLYERPEIEESTVSLLESFCRLAFDDKERRSIAMDTLLRIEAYWRERDMDRHLYVSYLIVEYIPGVLNGQNEMEASGYTPQEVFDVQAFIGRWHAHIERLTQEGRYAMAAQCRMIGVRHVRAEKGNRDGAQKLKDELEAIQKLMKSSLENKEDLTYLRSFSGLYGYCPVFLNAAVQHFSSRVLFMLADNGHLEQDAYSRAYKLVKKAQRILLSPEQYQDFAPYADQMCRRVKADILCTEGHVLLKMGKYEEAARVLDEGITQLDSFLVPLSQRFLRPYEDMICAVDGLASCGELDNKWKHLSSIYGEKIKEIRSGL